MSVIIDFFYPSISLQKECTSKSLFKSIVGPWQTVQSKFLSTSVYPPKHREVSQGSDQDVSVQINPATRPLGAIVREKNSPLQGLYNPSRRMILSEMNRSNSWEVSCRHHADAWQCYWISDRIHVQINWHQTYFSTMWLLREVSID